MVKKKVSQLGIGQVQFSINGKKSRGTASIIKAKNTYVISTAAHCIYDWKDKNVYRNIQLLYEDKVIKIKSVILHNFWANQARLDYDVAFLIPELDILENLDFKPIYPKFNHPYGDICLISGFENRILKDKYKLSFCRSFKDDIYNSTLIGANEKFKSGVSGGPWIIKNGETFYQIANTSLSFKQDKKKLWGAHWGDDIKKMFDLAINNNASVENVIKITL